MSGKVKYNMLKKTFHVTDMHCSNCAMRIEGLEDDLPGVQRVRASYHKQQVEVEYDESKLGAGEIIAAVRKLGYTVSD
jgi:copper chaperone CopZ